MPITVGNAAQPITVVIRNITARAFGDGKAPIIDIGAALVSVVAGGTQLNDLSAQIHSDGLTQNALVEAFVEKSTRDEIGRGVLL